MFKKIAFTMYPATDLARAKSFYEDTLGLPPANQLAGGQWNEGDVSCSVVRRVAVPPPPTPAATGAGAGSPPGMRRTVLQAPQRIRCPGLKLEMSSSVPHFGQAVVFFAILLPAPGPERPTRPPGRKSCRQAAIVRTGTRGPAANLCGRGRRISWPAPPDG